MTRADLLAGAALVALGLAVVVWSWQMPRLAERGIPPSTIPGLVPGMLGVALTVCGAILALRSLPALRDPAGWRAFAARLATPEAGRVATVVALTFGYALGLVGLLPFWLSTALFVLAFILAFERPLDARAVATAAAQALVVAVAVVLVFERGFLVRLP